MNASVAPDQTAMKVESKYHSTIKYLDPDGGQVEIFHNVYTSTKPGKEIAWKLWPEGKRASACTITWTRVTPVRQHGEPESDRHGQIIYNDVPL